MKHRADGTVIFRKIMVHERMRGKNNREKQRKKYCGTGKDFAEHDSYILYILRGGIQAVAFHEFCFG